MTDWSTSISSSGEDAVVRDIPLENVMEMEFSDAIYLVLRGKKPTREESELFSAILSVCIDHGIGNPSTVSARTVQSGGNPVNASVAAGVLALGDTHGGAIEGCMEMLESAEEPEKVVKERLERGEKMPGLGHRVYSEEDPRAVRIMEKAEELGIAGRNVRRIRDIRDALAEQKVELPINVDGAAAAALADMGWPSELGKGVFIVARTPGLVAHVHEEMDEEGFRREEGEYLPES